MPAPGTERVSVLIPFASEDPWRERALQHVLARYVQELGWSVHVGTTDGRWCKAKAVAAAARHAEGDVFVVADADCFSAGTPEAVQAVLDGAAWAMPHGNVRRLTQEATSRVLGGVEPSPRSPLIQAAYRGTSGGGIVVVPAATWREIPLDARFVGWGQEDESWALALSTLAGKPIRLHHDLWHLWHPPQPRLTRRIGSPEGKRLAHRYRAASNNPKAMAALVAEGRTNAEESPWAART